MAFTVIVLPVPDWGEGERWEEKGKRGREMQGEAEEGGRRRSFNVMARRKGDEVGVRDVMRRFTEDKEH